MKQRRWRRWWSKDVIAVKSLGRACAARCCNKKKNDISHWLDKIERQTLFSIRMSILSKFGLNVLTLLRRAQAMPGTRLQHRVLPQGRHTLSNVAPVKWVVSQSLSCDSRQLPLIWSTFLAGSWDPCVLGPCWSNGWLQSWSPVEREKKKGKTHWSMDAFRHEKVNTLRAS